MNEFAPKDHNKGPPISDANALVERLEENNNDMIARHAELVNALSRLPTDCTDEQTAKNLTTFGTQLRTCLDTLEERRKLEKRPYDELASSVHQFFKSKIDDLDTGIRSVKGVIKKYMDAEEAKRRKAQEEEAARQQSAAQELAENAQRLERSGLQGAAEQTLNTAIEIESGAKALQAQPVSAVLRGEVGGSASKSGRWKAEIIDIATIDLEALRPYFDRDAIQKAINGYMKIAVKPLGPTDECSSPRGTRIFRDSSVTFRG